MSVASHSTAGRIALVGSGEYLPVMDDIDRLLLDSVGGPSTARVVIMATAAGLEHPSSPQRWTDMGLRHFRALGVGSVTPATILHRSDALDPQWLPILDQADFYYFSGGNPQHVIDVFHDTPAWHVITTRHASGAVLAGCSAGAMAMGGRVLGLRALREGGLPQWKPALGVLPSVAVVPHFDRFGHVIPTIGYEGILATMPADSTIVGIDEETALVRLPDHSAWQVMGRQTVSIFRHETNQPTRRVLPVGGIVTLS